MPIPKFANQKIAKASMNTKPVKSNSKNHNERIGYQGENIHTELSQYNDTWKCDEITTRYQEIAKLTKELTGRAIQKKATPIREAVVNLNPHHTMAHCHELAQALNAKFGIECFQIHIHRDEGKLDVNGINYHAHFLFDWQDKKTGKSFKLNRLHMSEMQDVVSEVLDMERGERRENSNRKRLEATEYKAVMEERNIEQLKHQTKELEIKADLEQKKNTEFPKTFQGEISRFERRTQHLARNGIKIDQKRLRNERNCLERAIKRQRERIEAAKQAINDNIAEIREIETSDEFRKFVALAKRIDEIRE